MGLFLVTFDLSDATPGQYATAHKILEAHDLPRVVLTEGPLTLRLPETTHMGHGDSIGNAFKLRIRLVEAFAAAGLKLSALAVAEVSCWSVWGETLDPATLRPLGAQGGGTGPDEVLRARLSD